MSGQSVQDATFDELVEWARALAIPGQRRILGLTGAPGAGKSTVAADLVEALGTDRAVLAPMDGFHLANEVLIDLGRLDRKGAHDTFDDDGYARLIEAVRRQTPDGPIVYAPRFRREIEESIGSAIPVLPSVPLVVTEGNYLLMEIDAWPRARAHIDEVWFLAPDTDVRHDRLVRRHEAYGKTPEQAAFWALGSDERNAELITSTAVRADRVLRLR
ncbi:nucleoside/nucleotide kinase family protein [Rhodococcus sp. BP-149]|uniref:nucleoside/nucleotide kinase family protein n=1 Tax=unclassified Rhodococcus (in: high G+C Gram-positive bacteria) TaxID=192944 RepID=UPI001C9B86C1|nr:MULTISPECIES: nucleoside/nucleotide kinase family protein [unclassified Rhodococcus (in: high G+C Gram-positive bacteria)]MBY6687192.1 nucleoside/nucleotide kinase family protein [Rhodococcus sp. BP-288]MBY6694385.1 nucleoside/nucleotide kinase family protein [Rhodococcus sp. BP-188]MBY6698094.1 nucleoside/nucleotide kinase family protein [Rhodococcus sp. BP-285]MBY6704314.1 nucleoside/nucleotide kinase family protein [Rhodococcus sp. BP-283]MBY6712963.1 nucleoside/nucleotide kinase family 